MRLRAIIKFSGIGLLIFGIIWIAVIMMYPEVNFLREHPVGGVSFLFGFILWAIHRWTR